MEKNLGIVQMPLERYNEFILDYKRMMEDLDHSVPLKEYNELQELLDDVAKIETDWNDEPRLKINLGGLAARLREKFERSEFAGKWTMIDLSDHVVTAWDVFEEIPQVTDEEEDQA